MMIRTLLVLALSIAPAFGDLNAVKAEPNLEKRSDKALDYASTVLNDMREHYKGESMEKFGLSVVDFRTAVDLAVSSLEETGKNARRNPKYFKRAELRLRDFSRRLATLKLDIDVEERPLIDGLIEHIDKQRDGLVSSILEKKK
jgi:hypothetical protein